MRLLLPALLIIATTLMLGCNQPLTGTNGTQNPSSCVTDIQCMTGYYCDLARCVPGTRNTTTTNTYGCTIDTQCSSGYHCQNGACVLLTAGQCRSDADCGAGKRCEAGQCVNAGSGTLGAGCLSNYQCSTGEECISNTCQASDTVSFDWCIAGREYTSNSGGISTDNAIIGMVTYQGRQACLVRGVQVFAGETTMYNFYFDAYRNPIGMEQY